MNTVRYLAVSTVLAAGMAMTPANAVSINFDEFASPPVTCCYGSTGVTGPLNYPSVTVTAGDGGYVMNGSGWSNEQTSGYNLFGTLSGVMGFHPSGQQSGAGRDQRRRWGDVYSRSIWRFGLDTQSAFIGDYPGSAPWHFTYAGGGIEQATILGNGDFAIDTVSFSTVPEPSTWAMLMLGFAGLGLAGYRQAKQKVAIAGA